MSNAVTVHAQELYTYEPLNDVDFPLGINLCVFPAGMPMMSIKLWQIHGDILMIIHQGSFLLWLILMKAELKLFSRYVQEIVFVQEWNVKPRRGRQRKYWCKVVDHLFSSLGLDKAEWLEDIRKGSCSLKSFLGVAGEGIDERESGKFEEGLNSKVYRTFGKIVEFKKYLRGVGDAGTRLLFKFRSGTHGLNEELGRHRGREGRKECLLCDAECESVSHVLWDCPANVSIRSAFMLELRRELGDRFEHFQSLDSFEKSSYVLGSEAWEEYSSGLLGLIKDFVLSVWEERKVRLYGEHANVHQSHSQNDSGDLRGVAGGDGELGCLCGKAGTSHLCDGSAHSSGCVVNGSNAMAAV